MKDDSGQTANNLQRWYNGEKEGLDNLIQQHLSWIRSHVHKRLGSFLRGKADTIDYVQDALIQLLQYSPRFVVSDGVRFRILVAKIIENVLRDKYEWFTARRRNQALVRPLPPDTVLFLDSPEKKVKTPSKAAQQHEEEAWIRLGMELLSPQDREVVILRQWDTLSFVEIGERLDISEDAAWQRHDRAMIRLSKIVDALRHRDLDQLLED